MNKTTILIILLSATFFCANAQKKSELIAKIGELETTITALNDSISKAKREINSSNSKAELFEKENTELRDANATLLKNLSSFSQISKQNTETVNKALASLKEKEGQLKFITDDFSKNDSTAIAILTQAKQTLGPDAKVGIGNGDMLISNSLDFLFGSDSGTQLTESAKGFLSKIAQLIVANPNRSVYVEGLNITGEFDLTYQQVLAVGNELVAQGVPAERLQLLAKDGNFKEGVNVRFTSNHSDFYQKLKTTFK